MQNSVLLRCLLACSLAGAMLACGDDDSSDDGGGGKAGGGGGQSGGGKGGSSSSSGVADPDEINDECPTATPAPRSGKYALKGDCCYRRSNTARIEEFDEEEDGTEYSLEFKSSYFTVSNHPTSASLGPIVESAKDRFDKEEQLILFRFTVPREDGEWKSGKGKVQIGPGRYNCGEGTYSFYSDTAAPETSYSKDKARWASAENPATIDVDADAGKQLKADWVTNSNRELSYLPYLQASGERGLDWETVSSGFDVIEFPKLQDAIDCIGEREETMWDAAGATVSYVLVELNAKQPISGALGNITLAQLLSFGPIGAMKDMPKFDPLEAERCMPASGCQWIKLPDSLCPTTDEEREVWGCHVGYEDNPDDVPTKCTADEPTDAQDPDEGVTTEGQCCDPLGKSSSLPACNAFRVENDLVASAVEITDEPSDELQVACDME